MKCERCQFENIPGQKTCFKCGSVLGIEDGQIDIYPVRMAKWKKPFRSFGRIIRHLDIIPKDFITGLPSWLKYIFDDSVTGLFFSIIPGLAHGIKGRFKEIRWYFAAWLVLLLSGIFLFGSQAGIIFLAMAVGIHTGIAIQYKALWMIKDLAGKVVLIVVVLIALTAIYRYSPRLLHLTGGYINMDIPAKKIQTGDYFIGRTVSRQEIKRGSLVFVRPGQISNLPMLYNLNPQVIVCEIVGLGGEKFEINGDHYAINGVELDNKLYPVAKWLKINHYSIIIPSDSYFVNVEYRVGGHGMEISEYIRRACVINNEEIETKAFMQWMPLARKGFLKE